MTTPHVHHALISALVILDDPEPTIACIHRIEAVLAGVPHEILVVYDAADEQTLHTLESTPGLAHRLRLIKNQGRTEVAALCTAIPLVAGDVVAPVRPSDPVDSLPALAALIRSQHAAVAITTAPIGAGFLRTVDFLLGALAGIGVWNVTAGFRAYSADFLDRHEIISTTLPAATLELAAKAQFDHEPICPLPVPRTSVPLTQPLRPLLYWLRRALFAPCIVWAVWLLMLCGALVTTALIHPSETPYWKVLAYAALPAAAAFAFILAVRRVRGRTRLADTFFPLVLLNPLFLVKDEHALIAAGLLGLMAGAIIAMKRDNYLRYLAVAGLALVLTAVSESFILLLPALAAWLLFAGYTLARSKTPRERTRGFAIMAAAEIALMVFLLACILAENSAAPAPASGFSLIVSYIEFPLLVLAIIMLALGWRKSPHGKTPPYFSGVLALLVGLLTMLLNNVQADALSAPGADQTTLILCLVYTVSALHGPRRLHWFAPPLLLLAAAAYTFFHPA